MKKIGVLFLIDVLEEMGGTEKNLIQIASLLDSTKFEPTICCLKSGKVFNELRDKGFNAIDLKLKKIYGPRAFLKTIELIRILKKNQIKIMVTCFESSDFWGGFTARLAGVPVLISARRDMGFALKRRHIWAYRIFNLLFDKIITVCDAVKENIIRKEKTDPDKIQTIYNGVENYKNKPVEKDKLMESLGLRTDKLTVTMLANLAPVKGHKDLLAAAAEIIKTGDSVQFLLVGNSKNGYGNELANFADSLGIADRVKFCGFRSDIDEILSISDISVLSSTSEGFSNAILEYMSAGKPVVATDVGGNRELIIEGVTGFLVPPRNPSALANSISKLMQNENLRKEMGSKGRERVKACFTKEKMMENIESLFNKLLLEKTIQ